MVISLAALWRIEWRWEFQPRDLWVGVYWRVDDDPGETPWRYDYLGAPFPPRRVDVWICVVPCLPLHVWWPLPPATL
jgi:hypothetical protein